MALHVHGASRTCETVGWFGGGRGGSGGSGVEECLLWGLGVGGHPWTTTSWTSPSTSPGRVERFSLEPLLCGVWDGGGDEGLGGSHGHLDVTRRPPQARWKDSL